VFSNQKELRYEPEGLEAIESTTQKTHECTARVAESIHIEKRDAYESLRAGLQTVRDQLDFPRSRPLHESPIRAGPFKDGPLRQG